MQLSILGLDLLGKLIHLLSESLLVAQISTLVLRNLISLRLDPLVFFECILSGPLGILKLTLKSIQLILAHVTASLHFIVAAGLELFDDPLKLLDLLSHLVVALLELSDEFLEVGTVDVGGVTRLTHPQQFLDLLHLRRKSVILLVQVVVLVLEGLELRVTLGAVVLGLDLVEGLPALVEETETDNLLVASGHTVL